MDTVRRLASFALVIFAVLCIGAWATLVNPAAFGAIPNPVYPELFPEENRFMVILGFGFGALGLAYMVYPPSRDRDDDD